MSLAYMTSLTYPQKTYQCASDAPQGSIEAAYRDVLCRDILPNRASSVDPTREVLAKEIQWPLTANQQYVIERLYGLGGVEQDVGEIASELGVSSSAISQRRDLALRKMRNYA